MRKKHIVDAFFRSSKGRKISAGARISFKKKIRIGRASNDQKLICICFIPQRPVDNNLGSDRLVGPKALDRQIPIIEDN